MSPPQGTLTLSLISHTNAGKTTLARTLLRRDVGEVLDQAHVTDENQEYVMLDAEPDAASDAARSRLVVWDTPGFGDSMRLLQRLEGERNPLAWMLKQTWDRFTDRPLWCSQQAVKHVRGQTDAVLYLANASEDPAMAGYVEPEMKILGWIGKPVVVLLNQTGPHHQRGARLEDEGRWRDHLAPHEVVKDVVSLDAFARCWVQEGLLLERIRDVLPVERAALMEELIERWTARNLEVFHGATRRLGEWLGAAAADREALGRSAAGRLERRRAADALARRLEKETRQASADLIALHGLEGQAADLVRARIEDVSAPREKPQPWKASVIGGAAGGALGGLVADVAVGGLSFGGGAVAGAILGAMGLGGLAWAYQQIGDSADPRITWSDEFLDRSARDALLRYLAVAHFGRGGGEFREREHPGFWRDAVEAALSSRRGACHDVWEIARGGEPDSQRASERLVPVLEACLREILLAFYDGVDRFLGRPR